MKVAFIYAEIVEMARFWQRRREFPPFGVLYLAAAAEKLGHDVSVFAVPSKPKSLDLTSFDFVGYSIASSATFDALRSAHHIARYGDSTRVAVGGVHTSFYPEQTLRDFPVRVAGVGDCEDVIDQILRASSYRDLVQTNGVAYLDDDDRFFSTPPASSSLDSLPLPARHLLPRDRVFMRDRLAGTKALMAHVMFSRGCPYRCKYCAAGGKRIEYRSAESAEAELRHLVEKDRIEGLAVVDDNFIVNRTRVLEIARVIKPLGLKWSALSRVNTVTPELLEELAACGCVEIKYGIESGSQRLLRAMGKNITTQQIKDALTATNEVGIGVKAFLLHGFPGENRETTRETIELLDELGSKIDRISLFRFVPLPGAEVYERWEDYRIHGTHYEPGWDGDWSKFHIHHNGRHWWGNEREFSEMQEAYRRLKHFVSERWAE